MNWQQTKLYLECHGPKIGQMFRNGDRLARAVINAHAKWHKDILNPDLQNELIQVVSEYVERDCTVTEITELERRYGLQAATSLN